MRVSIQGIVLPPKGSQRGLYRRRRDATSEDDLLIALRERCLNSCQQVDGFSSTHIPHR